MGYKNFSAYGSVGILISLADYPLVVLVPAFLIEQFSLSLTIIGGIFFAARLIDLISDPVVGAICDYTKKNNLSYKSWIQIGCPIYLLCLWLVFSAPSDASISYITFAVLALYVSRTIVDIPHNALASYLAKDETERLQFFGSKSIFLVIGIAVSGGVVTLFKGNLSEALWAISLVSICLAIPIIFVFTYFLNEGDQMISQEKSLKISKPIFFQFTAFFLNQLGNGFAATLVILYINEVLNLPSLSGIFLGSLFISSAISIPVWISLARRFKTRELWSFAIAISCFIFALVPLITEGDWFSYLIICILAGACFGADAMLPPTILSNLINKAAKKPISNNGKIFSYKSALSKMSLVLPIVIAFPILDSLKIYNADFYNNGIVIFYAIVPILPKLLSLYYIRKSKAAERVFEI